MRRNHVVDIGPLLDDLMLVRDLVESARLAPGADAQQSSLRRAHAAVSKTERDLYRAFGIGTAPAPPGYGRSRSS